MLTKKFVYKTCSIISVSIFVAGLSVVPSSAQEQLASLGTSAKSDDFTYQLEGRPDPFEPFIRPKVATQIEPDEVVVDEKKLTGMQLFEPGQLTLVAVMLARNEKIAMVEDVTGKGYILKEGILIGRNGVISRITDDQVIVTETARTRAGKEIITTVVMRLNKEGD